MNDTEEFLEWFKGRGCKVTLGEIMQTRHGVEYRKFFSLLRRPPYGLDIRVTLNRREPSKNLYTLASNAEGLQSNGPSQRGKPSVDVASDDVVLAGQTHEYLRSSSPGLIPSVSLEGAAQSATSQDTSNTASAGGLEGMAICGGDVGVKDTRPAPPAPEFSFHFERNGQLNFIGG
jgi:hypothetical protein